MKDLSAIVGREVAALNSPAQNRPGHTPNQLADALLALRRPALPMKVLGGNDIGRRHRPTLGDLDILLLEDDLSGLARNRGGPKLPLHGIERRYPFLGDPQELALPRPPRAGLRRVRDA